MREQVWLSPGECFAAVLQPAHAVERAGVDHEGKAASASRDAVDGDFATEHFGESLADAQAEAGAAEAAGGGIVSLCERLEHPAHLLAGHADAAVGHLEAQF